MDDKEPQPQQKQLQGRQQQSCGDGPAAHPAVSPSLGVRYPFHNRPLPELPTEPKPRSLRSQLTSSLSKLPHGSGEQQTQSTKQTPNTNPNDGHSRVLQRFYQESLVSDVHRSGQADENASAATGSERTVSTAGVALQCSEELRGCNEVIVGHAALEKVYRVPDPAQVLRPDAFNYPGRPRTEGADQSPSSRPLTSRERALTRTSRSKPHTPIAKSGRKQIASSGRQICGREDTDWPQDYSCTAKQSSGKDDPNLAVNLMQKKREIQNTKSLVNMQSSAVESSSASVSQYQNRLSTLKRKTFLQQWAAARGDRMSGPKTTEEEGPSPIRKGKDGPDKSWKQKSSAPNFTPRTPVSSKSLPRDQKEADSPHSQDTVRQPYWNRASRLSPSSGCGTPSASFLASPFARRLSYTIRVRTDRSKRNSPRIVKCSNHCSSMLNARSPNSRRSVTKVPAKKGFKNEKTGTVVTPNKSTAGRLVTGNINVNKTTPECAYPREHTHIWDTPDSSFVEEHGIDKGSGKVKTAVLSNLGPVHHMPCAPNRRSLHRTVSLCADECTLQDCQAILRSVSRTHQPMEEDSGSTTTEMVQNDAPRGVPSPSATGRGSCREATPGGENAEGAAAQHERKKRLEEKIRLRDKEKSALEDVLRSRLLLTGKTVNLVVADRDLDQELFAAIDELGGRARRTNPDSGTFVVLTDFRWVAEHGLWCLDCGKPGVVQRAVEGWLGTAAGGGAGAGPGGKGPALLTAPAAVFDVTQGDPAAARSSSGVPPSTSRGTTLPQLPHSRGMELLKAAHQKQQKLQSAAREGDDTSAPPLGDSRDGGAGGSGEGHKDFIPAAVSRASPCQSGSSVPACLTAQLTQTEFQACLSLARDLGSRLQRAENLGLPIRQAEDFRRHELQEPLQQLRVIRERLSVRRQKRVYRLVRDDNPRVAIRVEHVQELYRPSFLALSKLPRDLLRLPWMSLTPIGRPPHLLFRPSRPASIAGSDSTTDDVVLVNAEDASLTQAPGVVTSVPAASTACLSPAQGSSQGPRTGERPVGARSHTHMPPAGQGAASKTQLATTTFSPALQQIKSTPAASEAKHAADKTVAKFRRTRPGLCEICSKVYMVLKHHVETETHKINAANMDSYRELNSFLQTFATTDSFLNKLISSGQSNRDVKTCSKMTSMSCDLRSGPKDHHTEIDDPAADAVRDVATHTLSPPDEPSVPAESKSGSIMPSHDNGIGQQREAGRHKRELGSSLVSHEAVAMELNEADKIFNKDADDEGKDAAAVNAGDTRRTKDIEGSTGTIAKPDDACHKDSIRSLPSTAQAAIHEGNTPWLSLESDKETQPTKAARKNKCLVENVLEYSIYTEDSEHDHLNEYLESTYEKSNTILEHSLLVPTIDQFAQRTEEQARFENESVPIDTLINSTAEKGTGISEISPGNQYLSSVHTRITEPAVDTTELADAKNVCYETEGLAVRLLSLPTPEDTEDNAKELSATELYCEDDAITCPRLPERDCLVSDKLTCPQEISHQVAGSFVQFSEPDPQSTENNEKYSDPTQQWSSVPWRKVRTQQTAISKSIGEDYIGVTTTISKEMNNLSAQNTSQSPVQRLQTNVSNTGSTRVNDLLSTEAESLLRNDCQLKDHFSKCEATGKLSDDTWDSVHDNASARSTINSAMRSSAVIVAQQRSKDLSCFPNSQEFSSRKSVGRQAGAVVVGQLEIREPAEGLSGDEIAKCAMPKTPLLKPFVSSRSPLARQHDSQCESIANSDLFSIQVQNTSSVLIDYPPVLPCLQTREKASADTESEELLVQVGRPEPEGDVQRHDRRFQMLSATPHYRQKQRKKAESKESVALAEMVGTLNLSDTWSEKTNSAVEQEISWKENQDDAKKSECGRKLADECQTVKETAVFTNISRPSQKPNDREMKTLDFETLLKNDRYSGRDQQLVYNTASSADTTVRDGIAPSISTMATGTKVPVPDQTQANPRADMSRLRQQLTQKKESLKRMPHTQITDRLREFGANPSESGEASREKISMRIKLNAETGQYFVSSSSVNLSATSDSREISLIKDTSPLDVGLDCAGKKITDEDKETVELNEGVKTMSYSFSQCNLDDQDLTKQCADVKLESFCPVNDRERKWKEQQGWGRQEPADSPYTRTRRKTRINYNEDAMFAYADFFLENADAEADRKTSSQKGVKTRRSNAGKPKQRRASPTGYDGSTPSVARGKAENETGLSDEESFPLQRQPSCEEKNYSELDPSLLQLAAQKTEDNWHVIDWGEGEFDLQPSSAMHSVKGASRNILQELDAAARKEETKNTSRKAKVDRRRSHRVSRERRQAQKELMNILQVQDNADKSKLCLESPSKEIGKKLFILPEEPLPNELVEKSLDLSTNPGRIQLENYHFEFDQPRYCFRHRRQDNRHGGNLRCHLQPVCDVMPRSFATSHSAVPSTVPSTGTPPSSPTIAWATEQDLFEEVDVADRKGEKEGVWSWNHAQNYLMDPSKNIDSIFKNNVNSLAREVSNQVSCHNIGSCQTLLRNLNPETQTQNLRTLALHRNCNVQNSPTSPTKVPSAPAQGYSSPYLRSSEKGHKFHTICLCRGLHSPVWSVEKSKVGDPIRPNCECSPLDIKLFDESQGSKHIQHRRSVLGTFTKKTKVAVNDRSCEINSHCNDLPKSLNPKGQSLVEELFKRVCGCIGTGRHFSTDSSI